MAELKPSIRRLQGQHHFEFVQYISAITAASPDPALHHPNPALIQWSTTCCAWGPSQFQWDKLGRSSPAVHAAAHGAIPGL